MEVLSLSSANLECHFVGLKMLGSRAQHHNSGSAIPPSECEHPGVQSLAQPRLDGIYHGCYCGYRKDQCAALMEGLDHIHLRLFSVTSDETQRTAGIADL